MGHDERDRLRRALGGGAWSMSSLLVGVDRALDSEGRPIAERRAPSAVKAGVPIELAPCPYDDERRGLPMNVSALEQIKRHLKPVHADVEAFHAALGGTRDGWTAFAMAVIDQLAGPARHLLEARAADARVPAPIAVGYKLAAGYFDATRRLIEVELTGRAVPPSVDALMELVHRERLLVGASEVCAGPPKLIRRTTRVLLGDRAGAATPVPARRVTVAEALLDQLRLGIAWRCFDSAAERALFELMAGRVTPANAFLRAELSARRAQLAAEPDPGDVRLVADRIDEGARDPSARAFASALRSFSADAERPAPELEAIAARGRSALRFDDPSTGPLLARRLGAYLALHRHLLDAQWALERRIRAAIAFDLDAPLALGGLIAPRGRARRWLEAAIGRVSADVDVHRGASRTAP